MTITFGPDHTIFPSPITWTTVTVYPDWLSKTPINSPNSIFFIYLLCSLSLLATLVIHLSVLSPFYCKVAFWQLFLLNEYEWMTIGWPLYKYISYCAAFSSSPKRSSGLHLVQGHVPSGCLGMRSAAGDCYCACQLRFLKRSRKMCTICYGRFSVRLKYTRVRRAACCFSLPCCRIDAASAVAPMATTACLPRTVTYIYIYSWCIASCLDRMLGRWCPSPRFTCSLFPIHYYACIMTETGSVGVMAETIFCRGRSAMGKGIPIFQFPMRIRKDILLFSSGNGNY